LARESVPIFEKADMTSKVVATTPAGMTQLDTNFRVAGLKDPGPYWHVHGLHSDLWIWGYIHNDDVA
jgi:hypothetical protein